ncbi:hypothetical protein P171DRAFT_445532 [Karstenula rhodostoma CBS 690.94]|uniref:Uncharacterized protein n=1 Tax=Karstenula rhodostoma CBS 690.94 TaxID=1392251 RepID=A0A9P4PFE3_9PLEO|nr:hypothetical protein P171DRAFT_445532 [Karstenula rhodostoma CBS 690.94]
MRSFIVLALAGASVAAPFKYYHLQPNPSKPYPPGGWPSYTTGSPVIPGPTGTGIHLPPIPTGVSPPEPPVISTPDIPSISTPSIPSGTGIFPPIIPTGTGTPYYPTPAVDRRGLEIDYKLAPRIPDGSYGAAYHPHPPPPHGTGYPHGTGKLPGFPFPTGTSGFGIPTALPTSPVHIY